MPRGRKSDDVPALILCAGIPRSGSTWLYNAVRILLDACYATDVYGCWIADYDSTRAAKFHVVKIHEPNDGLALQARAIFTSHRDLRDIAASAWLKGWVKDEPSALQFIDWAVAFHSYWVGRGALDVSYKEINADPAGAIRKISARLGLESNTELTAVLKKLALLQHVDVGGERYHPETLIHPRHASRNGRSGYFTEVLPDATVRAIETKYRDWFSDDGFGT